MLSVRRSIISLFLGAVSLGAGATQPVNPVATTSPADGPSTTAGQFLSALDRQDRPAALAQWDTSTRELAQIASAQVDIALAVARLKHAVAARWGDAAPYDLQMAVVGSDECGDITDTIAGNIATVKVASKDSQSSRGPDSYQMVRIGKRWLLSITAEEIDRPKQVTAEQEQAVARRMIKLIDEVGKDVQAGKCTDTNDVLRQISEGMGSP